MRNTRVKDRIRDAGIAISRRTFLGFVILGGLLGAAVKRAVADDVPKRAMFWRRLP